MLGVRLGIPTAYLIYPDFEPFQHGGSRGFANRDISGVLTSRDHRPGAARHVVSRIKSVPITAKIALIPIGDIHRKVRGEHADVV